MTSNSSEGSHQELRNFQTHTACPLHSSLTPTSTEKPFTTTLQDRMGVQPLPPSSQPPHSTLHPQAPTWLRASRCQLLLHLPGWWGSHGRAFPESRHFHHMRQDLRENWEAEGGELGWPKAQEKTEKAKALGVGNRLGQGKSDTSSRGRVWTGRGNFRGDGEVKGDPQKPILNSSQITLQLLSPSPKVLELQGADHSSLPW